MEKANIGLSEDQKKESALILNEVLSSEYVLYTKTRNFHWNIVGAHFNDLHKFFEEQYEEIDESIDEIAERIRMLGIKTNATLEYFNKISKINENLEFPSSEKMTKELQEDHELMIRDLREKIETLPEAGDAGNEDFLNALMQKHEKMAWMLRSINQ
jgi:starvation-inducible DNA-binding protein